MTTVHISRDDPRYPFALRSHADATTSISALVNIEIVQRKKLALFCSMKCPGSIILQTYDLARALRDAEVPIISGFHSPMENECLSLLLRGTQSVIICPARSLEKMRIPAEWKAPLTEGRMLLLSPFAGNLRRPTVELAQKRNEFVAALADELFVAHATPGSKTEHFCHEVLTRGKPLLTLKSDENANLLALGARSVQIENIAVSWGPGRERGG